MDRSRAIHSVEKIEPQLVGTILLLVRDRLLKIVAQMPEDSREELVNAVLAEIGNQSVAIDKSGRVVPSTDFDPDELPELELFAQAAVRAPIMAAAVASPSDDPEAQSLNRSNNIHRALLSDAPLPLRGYQKERHRGAGEVYETRAMRRHAQTDDPFEEEGLGLPLGEGLLQLRRQLLKFFPESLHWLLPPELRSDFTPLQWAQSARVGER